MGRYDHKWTRWRHFATVLDRGLTKKEVRSFLGLVGWYRRFIPQFSKKAVPFMNLTAKAIKNPIPWTEECEKAFITLKERMCTVPVLRSPDFTKKFLVQVDALVRGIGTVLIQEDEGQEHNILYLSRKLLPRETRYATIEKEGLAIKWALDSLRYYLMGREFILETDHRALTWINTIKDQNARMTRWYLSLQPFKFHVRYKAGKSNVTADYLSRLPDVGNLGEVAGDVTGVCHWPAAELHTHVFTRTHITYLCSASQLLGAHERLRCNGIHAHKHTIHPIIPCIF